MFIKLTVTGADTAELRAMLAELSKSRHELPSHYNWRPRVNCEGPDYFGIETDPLPPQVAEAVIEAGRQHSRYDLSDAAEGACNA